MLRLILFLLDIFVFVLLVLLGIYTGAVMGFRLFSGFGELSVFASVVAISVAIWLIIISYVFSLAKLGNFPVSATVGIRIKNLPTAKALCKAGVGILLDVLLLPVTIISLLFGKPLLSDRLCGVECRVHSLKLIMVIPWVLWLLIGGAGLYLGGNPPYKVLGAFRGTYLHYLILNKVIRTRDLSILQLVDTSVLQTSHTNCLRMWLESRVLSDVCIKKIRIFIRPDYDRKLRVLVYLALLTDFEFNIDIAKQLLPMLRVEIEDMGWLDILEWGDQITYALINIDKVSREIGAKQDSQDGTEILDDSQDFYSVVTRLSEALVHANYSLEDITGWVPAFGELLLDMSVKDAKALIELLYSRWPNEIWVNELYADYYLRIGDSVRAQFFLDRIEDLR